MQQAFDPDFASPAEWAVVYRFCCLQVVPAHTAVKGGEWKFPLLPWGEFQNNLVSEAVFDRWYGVNGEHAARQNMGVITGRCSRNVFVIDLDDQKGPQAAEWWHGILEIHNSGIDPETVEQRTGGGGRQKLFRAPMDWVAPTNKTTINVDIRGQGGFAMTPPSRHESGRYYEWLPGRAPWEIPIADAPEWLLEEIEKLVEQHGGVSQSGRTRTLSPGGDVNAFGGHEDGREEYMTKLVWAAVIGYRREGAAVPGALERDAVWIDYERNTRSRLPDDGRPNAERLEEEGRGPSLFANKWRRAVKKWDGQVKEAAAQPKPGELPDPEPQIDPATGKPLPLILTSKQFADSLVPPAYIIDGIIQRGFLYSLTARTGHGKTAVIMRAAAAIARGEKFAECDTKQGSVLFFAGENPQDVRARYVAMCDTLGIDTNTFPFYFIDGRLNIEANLVRIRAEAESIPDLRMIVIDTAAAYFQGDDGNSNAQLGAYAGLLRKLTFLPSLPTGIVNCHPVKNAPRDSLLPMGGSAFVNEVDGNLTLWADDDRGTTLHWQGKFRGPEFDPLHFELKEIHSDRVKDEHGVLMSAIMAVFMPENVAERRDAVGEGEDNILLRLIHADKHATFPILGKRSGFSKSKVQRIVKRLKDDRMVRKFNRYKYRVTKKGCEAAGIKIEGDFDEN